MDLYAFKEDQPTDQVPHEIDPFRHAMAEALNCAVCNEVFIDPHLLSCGHCFCGPCLVNWFATKKSCPKCRLAVVRAPVKAYCIQNAADVLCEHSSNINRSGTTERIKREQWKSFFPMENESGYILDAEDNVRRCVTCAWEIGTDNFCHHCGAEYNSDPNFRDDTEDSSVDSDSDSDVIDYAREFGVSVEQQRHIYEDIRRNTSNTNTNANLISNNIYELEVSDEDNYGNANDDDDDSVNMNYRDGEDLDEFVVSDNHTESSQSQIESQDESVSNNSGDEYFSLRRQSISVDDESSEDDFRSKVPRLKRKNGIYVIDDEDDDNVETVDSDDNDDSTVETQPPQVIPNKNKIKHRRVVQYLSATSSEDDNTEEILYSNNTIISSNDVGKLDKGKKRMIEEKPVIINDDESESSDNVDDTDESDDGGEDGEKEEIKSQSSKKPKEIDSKSKKDSSKAKKEENKHMKEAPSNKKNDTNTNQAESSKFHRKNSSKKRKRNKKGKGKNKKLKSA